jgi:hypothetical protein
MTTITIPARRPPPLRRSQVVVGGAGGGAQADGREQDGDVVLLKDNVNITILSILINFQPLPRLAILVEFNVKITILGDFGLEI